jgi:2,6-dihydroxypyridine 3-monooxygenase
MRTDRYGGAHDPIGPTHRGLYASPSSQATLPPGTQLRVLIVGGSIGGCCAAIALAAAGERIEVNVFEADAGELRSQGAGLLVQPDMAAFLNRYNVEVRGAYLESEGRQTLDARGAVVDTVDDPQNLSAWDVMHRALRGAVPAGRIHTGRKVVWFAADENGVRVRLEDGEEWEGDLLVGADGCVEEPLIFSCIKRGHDQY